MAHLRRDARGLPVPYVNRWGPEDLARISVRHDRNVGMDAVFLDDSAELVPDFTAQNMQRQRECVVQGLCQICGRKVPWSRRYLVVSAISVQRIDVGGRPAVAIFEPWLDQQCAMVAVQRCPALVRRKRGDDLSLALVTSAREVQLSASVGAVDGPLAERTREHNVAMWCKIVVPDAVLSLVKR